MPLYEYECKKCGALFEVLQNHSAEPLTEHKDCGGPVERLISPPAFHFKGSGFYITDYAKGSGNGSRKTSKEEGKREKAPPAAKTETPAAKPAPEK